MEKKSLKTRLDIWLTEQRLVPSRQRAQALILAGCVYVNEQPAKGASQSIREDDRVELRKKDHPYVSRGGVKLAHAIETFSVPVKGRVAIDIGASTGGFTDCLLQEGALHVYALDVGYGQLDWKLRQDKRVVCIERCNVRYWKGEEVADRVGVITVDVSFISLKKVLPAVLQSLSGKLEPESYLVALIKPQFEAGRSEVASGGVIRDQLVQKRVVTEISDFVSELHWKVLGVTPSPIKGPKGNQEYLLVAKRTGKC